MSQYDQAYIFMPLDQAQLFFGKEGVWDEVDVNVVDPDHLDAIKSQVQQVAGKGAVGVLVHLVVLTLVLKFVGLQFETAQAIEQERSVETIDIAQLGVHFAARTGLYQNPLSSSTNHETIHRQPDAVARVGRHLLLP